MSLTCVRMTEEVWFTCLTHALSTETEEIMGLLLGDIETNNGSTVALIWAALPQLRSERKKDRVETNPEQLTAASLQAERMTSEIGKTTRVIGWYHSHPRMTVLPSHVDVRTQAMYQLLDSGFVGLIFSCFSEYGRKVGRIQVIAFQSSDGKQKHTLRPVSVSPAPKSSVVEIESSLSSSEKTLPRHGSTRGDGPEEDTSDSKASSGFHKAGGRSPDLGGFFANADARTGETQPSNSSTVEIDPMDMSESVQEAMHRSNLEISAAEYVRKEVPLYVQPASTILNLDSPLASFADLQRVIYDEERSAYHQAIENNMRVGLVHPLTYIHHTSTYQASICKLMEYCLGPAIHSLQVQLRENEIRMEMLADEAKILESILESKISRGTEASSSNPRPSHSISQGSGSSSRSRKGSQS